MKCQKRKPPRVRQVRWDWKQGHLSEPPKTHCRMCGELMYLPSSGGRPVCDKCQEKEDTALERD